MLGKKPHYRQCNYRSIPVITAHPNARQHDSQPAPTRAEASDVANAINRRDDGELLSKWESALGAFPVKSVAMLARIATDVEAGFAFDNDPPTGI